MALNCSSNILFRAGLSIRHLMSRPNSIFFPKHALPIPQTFVESCQMFLNFFWPTTLGFRVRFQRPPQVVFDFFHQGAWFEDLGQRAEA